MKKMRKIFALLIAMVMVFGMSTSVFAAGTGSITITPPSGTDANATNTYKIYKVFDADGNGTAISYKVMSSKADVTLPTGFVTDAAGNVIHGTKAEDGTITPNTATQLTAAEIAAIKTYINGDTPVATATSTGTANAVTENLPNGYYYIETSTGSVVTINSTNPNVEVIDKNTVPSVDKKITGATSIDDDGKKALAQVGTTVTYSAEITVGNGAKGYVFHDTMEAGLTYNNDAAVTGVTAGENTYTVGKEGTDTFTITFNDTYVAGLEAGTKFTVTYSATVNDNAVTVDPLNNTAYLNYGDANSNNKTPVSQADVYEAKFTVTKQDGNNQPLPDAGFVLKNTDGNYYKLTTNTTGEGDTAVTTNVVSWVENIDDATEYKSDAQGAVTAFTGLANGTYTLIEKTVPAGYNKAADQSFTISEHSYTATNLEQTATVTNEAGSVLPSTGGIGTTMFYVIGAALVLGAGIVMVSKRRMDA